MTRPDTRQTRQEAQEEAQIHLCQLLETTQDLIAAQNPVETYNAGQRLKSLVGQAVAAAERAMRSRS